MDERIFPFTSIRISFFKSSYLYRIKEKEGEREERKDSQQYTLFIFEIIVVYLRDALKIILIRRANCPCENGMVLLEHASWRIARTGWIGINDSIRDHNYHICLRECLLPIRQGRLYVIGRCTRRIAIWIADPLRARLSWWTILRVY